MNNWIHALPLGWMALVIFGATFLVAAAIYAIVMKLATEDRTRAFKGVSAGLLSPLGVIFGLLVAFLAAQVWGDIDRGRAAVNHEASALRGVVLLSRAFPGETQTRVRTLIDKHVDDVLNVEWPAMAGRRATLAMIPTPLAEVLELTLTMPITGEGQAAAQREIVSTIDAALDARRQRLLISNAQINLVKWLALFIQAICTLTTIAMVHCDNRASARIALGLFGTAIAVCIFLLAAHDRPFTGSLSVSPAALRQVRPD